MISSSKPPVLLCILSCIVLPFSLLAGNGPQWWAQRGVIDSQRPADDYAAANLGQLKHMATQAAAEFNAKLSGGAGTAINSLIASWQQAPAAGVTRDDFAPLNIGQLKAVGKLFYDRLIVAGVVMGYPWTITGAHESHGAVANLGQLKTVFSFVAGVDPNNPDSDGDGLSDAWELEHFHNLGRAGNEMLTAGGLRMRDVFKFNLDLKTLNDGTATAGADGGIAPASAQTDIFVYDSRGRLTRAQLGSGNANRTYTHDDENNIASVQ